MTAQIPDTISFNGTTYSIAGIRGTGLFDPAQHGLLPVPSVTSCWRGFVCRYLLQDDLLILDSLLVNHSAPVPPLLGVEPSRPDKTAFFDAQYNRLGHQVSFTGELLAGNGFIQELYVHMGFHPSWKYQEVHHFAFSEGQLTDHKDRSQEAARFREMVRKYPKLGELSIAESFSLGFDPWAV